MHPIAAYSRRTQSPGNRQKKNQIIADKIADIIFDDWLGCFARTDVRLRCFSFPVATESICAVRLSCDVVALPLLLRLQIQPINLTYYYQISYYVLVSRLENVKSYF